MNAVIGVLSGLGLAAGLILAGSVLFGSDATDIRRSLLDLGMLRGNSEESAHTALRGGPLWVPEGPSDTRFLDRLSRSIGNPLVDGKIGKWMDSGLVARWLEICDETPAYLAGQMAISAAAGLISALFAIAVSSAMGLALPLTGLLGGLLLCCLGTGCAPLVSLRTRAQTKKAELRKATGAFLDLVVLALAGGMGLEGAFQAAGEVGKSWGMIRIVQVLNWGRDAGLTPWASLGLLGARYGVSQLEELSAMMALAGAEGAKVRESLAAKAASLRVLEQAEAESAANALTERMFLPGVVLLVGFLVFIGYPAFVRVLVGL
jgi:tight adherence protein C